MRGAIIAAAGIALISVCGRVSVAGAAKEITHAQESYFHLYETVAFAKAFLGGRCKDGLKMASMHLDESQRAIQTVDDSEQLKKLQDEAAENLKAPRPERAALEDLGKQLIAYGKQHDFRPAKTWDRDVNKRCNSAMPF